MKRRRQVTGAAATGAERAVGAGDPASCATLLLAVRCAQLNAPAPSIALAVAWQHAALFSRSRTPKGRLPPLERFDHSVFLTFHLARLSERLVFLKDHLPVLTRLIAHMPPWAELLEAVPSTAVADCMRTEDGAAGLWTDPAGDILDVLEPRRQRMRDADLAEPSAVALAVESRETRGAILDPFCRTGRRLCTAAARLDAMGDDPWEYGFFGLDPDRVELALACINLIGAGAGPYVWLHQGDLLDTEFVRPDGTRVLFDGVLADMADAAIPEYIRRPRKVVVHPSQRAHAWDGGRSRTAASPSSTEPQPRAGSSGETPPRSETGSTS